MKLDKRTLIRWKIVVFINTLGDNTYGKYLVRYSFISIPVLLVVFIGLSLVLGYIDSRLGIRREEQRNISTSNPVQMEILQILRELEKRGQRPE
jgi:hypothetical protein